MKKIGKQINEFRIKKGLSQENVYPDNNSLVSQIEKGTIKNPNEQTLRIFAKNLGISFDELVHETDWNRNRTKVKTKEYAISQTDPIITIEESGKINVKMKSYPRFNDAGEENKYCPKDGTELITSCFKCGRIIDTPDIKFCMGCSNKLMVTGYNKDNYVDRNALYDIRINEEEQEKFLEAKQRYQNQIWMFQRMLNNKNTHEFYDTIILPEIHDRITYTVDESEFFKLDKSDVPEVRRGVLGTYYLFNYYIGVIHELKKYAHLILENDENNRPPSLEINNDENENNEKEEHKDNG